MLYCTRYTISLPQVRHHAELAGASTTYYGYVRRVLSKALLRHARFRATGALLPLLIVISIFSSCLQLMQLRISLESLSLTAFGHNKHSLRQAGRNPTGPRVVNRCSPNNREAVICVGGYPRRTVLVDDRKRVATTSAVPFRT